MPDARPRPRAGERLAPPRRLLFVSRIWAWVFLALMVLFFVVAVPLTTGGAVNFLTIRNSQNILVAIIPVLLLGLGQTFVIIAAGIDLSVGWVMSLGLGAVGAGAALGLQRRRAAVSLGPRRPVAGARRRGAGRPDQRRDHRQAQGAGVHRHARHLVHRARRRLSDEREHDGDRPARRHPRLWQRRARLLHSRRGRRPLLPASAGGERRAAAAHGHRSCPIPSSSPRWSSPGRCSCSAAPSSAATPTRSAAAWTPRCAPASRSTATSSSSMSFPPRPPASPASCRRCASRRARR